MVYGLIADIRNWLFDSGLLAEYRPGTLTISVGNLTVGGTGKTPFIEYLIKRFAAIESAVPFETVTLSRGYGRRTTGFRRAGDADTAETIGDEPRQLYHKFGHLAGVCVGERRADAIRIIEKLYPQTKRILLDDAYQHRAVRPHLNLLLMDYNRPFYADYPFPAGRLREHRHGASRADAIIVTKCPNDIQPAEIQKITEKIIRCARPHTPIFFAEMQYDQPVCATLQSHKSPRGVVLVSGLANADPLERYVRQAFELHYHHRFADHWAYTRADLDQFLATLPPGASLLTTEKDWVKLDALLTPAERATLPFFYLPVRMVFLGDGERAFGAFLETAIRKIC